MFLLIAICFISYYSITDEATQKVIYKIAEKHAKQYDSKLHTAQAIITFVESAYKKLFSYLNRKLFVYSIMMSFITTHSITDEATTNIIYKITKKECISFLCNSGSLAEIATFAQQVYKKLYITLYGYRCSYMYKEIIKNKFIKPLIKDSPHVQDITKTKQIGALPFNTTKKALITVSLGLERIKQGSPLSLKTAQKGYIATVLMLLKTLQTMEAQQL
jgi:hypothetical protein